MRLVYIQAEKSRFRPTSMFRYHNATQIKLKSLQMWQAQTFSSNNNRSKLDSWTYRPIKFEECLLSFTSASFLHQISKPQEINPHETKIIASFWDTPMSHCITDTRRFLTGRWPPEDGTTKLSRNVRHQSPSDESSYPVRRKITAAPIRRPKIPTCLSLHMEVKLGLSS